MRWILLIVGLMLMIGLASGEYIEKTIHNESFDGRVKDNTEPPDGTGDVVAITSGNYPFAGKGQSNDYYRGFFAFNLTSVSGTITEAKLGVTTRYNSPTTNASENISVYHSNWANDGTTSLLAADYQLSSISLIDNTTLHPSISTSTRYNITVTSQVQADLDASKTFFAVKMAYANESYNMTAGMNYDSYYSFQDYSHAGWPLLYIIYTPPGACTDAGSDGITNGIIVVNTTSGCPCDGVDDQVQINYAVANGSGKYIYLDGTEYNITGELNNINNSVIYGNGDSTVLNVSTISSPGVLFNASNTNLLNITYRDFNVTSAITDLKVFGHLNNLGLNYYDITVRNISTSGNGVTVVGFTDTGLGPGNIRQNLTVINSTGAHDGISFSHWTNVWIEGNTITSSQNMCYDNNRNNENVTIIDNWGSVGTGNYGIRTHGGGIDTYIANNTIDGPNTASKTRACIMVDAAQDYLQENNTCYNSYIYMSFETQGTTTNVTVKNDVAYDVSYGISTNGVNVVPDFSGNFSNIVIDDVTIDGVLLDYDIDLNIENSIISNVGQYGVRRTAGNIDMSYSDIYNTGSGMYSGTVTGIENITSDPLYYNSGANDYHLNSTNGTWNGSAWVNMPAGSPCIDTGDPTSDYSNEPSPNGSRINMGAYGNTDEASKSTAAPSVNTSTIIIPANSYGMINNWTVATNFSNIATNESNDVAYSYYNVTTEKWVSHYPPYSWNSGYVIPLEASVMVFVNAETTVTATIVTPTNTNLYIGWNMLFVEGTDNESVSSIIADIGANCTDAWWFNSTAGAYSNTSSDTVQPCQGFLSYITQDMTWIRSDL